VGAWVSTLPPLSRLRLFFEGFRIYARKVSNSEVNPNGKGRKKKKKKGKHVLGEWKQEGSTYLERTEE